MLRIPLAVLLLTAATSTTMAQTLSAPLDSGSLAPGWSIVGNTVRARGALTYTQTGTAKYEWTYFVADGLSTADTTTFIIDRTDHRDAGFGVAGHRFVYSYDNGITWASVNNGSAVNATDYVFSHKFTQANVLVASGIPYTVAQTQAHTASLMSNPRVSPTISSTASPYGTLVFNRSHGTTAAKPAYGGRVIPQQDMYSYKITDLSVTAPKTKIVMIAGNHQGETVAHYALQGMVNFLTGPDPRAAELAKVAEFFVYPQIDPDGRYGGYTRSNHLAPDVDHNRAWNRTNETASGYDDIAKTRNAILADTGGSAEYFFDFHAQKEQHRRIFTDPTGQNSEFITILRGTYIPDLITEGNLTVDPNQARGWARDPLTLGATYSFTPEIGFTGGWTVSQFEQLGEYYALSLHSVLVVPEPGSTALLAIAGLTAACARRRRCVSPAQRHAGDHGLN